MNAFSKNQGFNTVRIAVAGAALLWLGSLHPGAAAAEKPRLSVVYQPPRLSLEARGVSVGDVLAAIGAQVSFAVVNTAPPQATLTLSIKDATLEEVLRQLLRPQSYVLIYRDREEQGVGAGIEKIVLLGPSTPAQGSAGLASGKVVRGEYEETVPSPTGPPDSLRGELPPPPVWPAQDSRQPPRRIAEQERSQSPPAGSGARLPDVGAVTGLGRPSPDPPPHGAPDPESIKQDLLDRVRTMVDAVRSATLDTPRGNRTP